MFKDSPFSFELPAARDLTSTTNLARRLISPDRRLVMLRHTVPRTSCQHPGTPNPAAAHTAAQRVRFRVPDAKTGDGSSRSGPRPAPTLPGFATKTTILGSSSESYRAPTSPTCRSPGAASARRTGGRANSRPQAFLRLAGTRTRGKPSDDGAVEKAWQS